MSASECAFILWLLRDCSANYGHCLLNRPARNYLVSGVDGSKLPGEYFNEDKQCQFVFGQDARICSYMVVAHKNYATSYLDFLCTKPSCSRLWCTTVGGEENGCRTQHMPWADGTFCEGEDEYADHWCIRGQCVVKEESRPSPTDGQWGGWGR